MFVNKLRLGRKKIAIIFLIFVIIVLIILGIGQFVVLRKAHSTFENYYAFRGCVQLLERTQDYGICKIASGQIIKIVKINENWYLEGDGPGEW